MKKLTMKQIEAATGGRLFRGSGDAEVTNVCTDSRQAKVGDLFFALIGDNRDAHRYLPQVAEAGCRCVVVSDEAACRELGGDFQAVLVEDTTIALQELASFYLKLLNIKKIAVTGSTGKTSTRDLTWHVCSERYKTGKNAKNFNNLIGVPLTILSFDEDTEVAVIEMGMDRFGELDRLANLIRPDIGIITNIGMAHIENLGSQENIFKAKMELTHYFDETSVLIIHQEGEFLQRDRVQGVYRTVTTGFDGKSDFIIISDIDDLGAEGIQFTLEHQGQTQEFQLPTPGRHNAFNAALAVAAGAQLGITMEEAARGLSKAKLTDKRLTIRGKNGIKVIDDTYNASPDSMKAGIDVLMHTRGLRSVAVLGDMLELGETSKEQHRLVGSHAARQGVELLVAVGSEARQIAEGAKAAGLEQALWFPKKERFLTEMDSIIQKGDVVLVKGSRGMAMEDVVKRIME